ncbi:MAG TPA: Asp-tRNA(Asn)/Glu-tRNA(Gln) amidotransferase subunit GatB [Caldisericia bacterium]|nr:Asp-tRNA(Asn)/Glu-tRNA(Gln) amidotransferase subunit GatB [Caldisericia bacterium]HPP43730.1 Asp-tRNA(Asn)/Glu-tRNA(Gln) amidotransferase subunit GatB [Caldisericia bacterium]
MDKVIIGLEIHAQLNTKTKMFCKCKVDFSSPPNSNICPTCLGLPGALPSLNEKVVLYALMIAQALNCEINRKSLFHRKNYFYPDLPKGYQISQYDTPLAKEGFLKLPYSEKVIRIIRVHIEEDAGKLVHPEDIMEANYSYVDYNRAGVPLVEIVTYPDMNSPDEAVKFLEELREILIYLGVSTGNMEEGALRCDANVSIEGHNRCEVKNMNSFRSIKRALEYEINRHLDLISKGEKIVQETRHFNESDGKTYSMRGKEEAEDYRYFPDPDLPPLIVSEDLINEAKSNIKELPNDIREKLKNFSLLENEIETLVSMNELRNFYFEVLKTFPEPRVVANFLLTDVLGTLNEKNLSKPPFSPVDFGKAASMFFSKEISSKILKRIIELLFEGKNLDYIINNENILPITSKDEIRKIVLEVLEENMKVKEDYKKGKERALTFLIGQAMAKGKGRLNPEILKEVLLEELNR